MKKKIIMVIITVFVISLLGCERREKDSSNETETSAAAELKADVAIEAVTDDALPPDSSDTDDIFDIKVYTFMFDAAWPDRQGINPVWFTYETISVSRSKIKEDTFEYAKSLGITNHLDLAHCKNIWYEGNKLNVDFSGDIVQAMEGLGTFAAITRYREFTIFHTLLSFPDVEELEFFIEGKQNTYWSDESGRTDFNYVRNAVDMKKSLENFNYGIPPEFIIFDQIEISDLNNTRWFYNPDLHNYSFFGNRITFMPFMDSDKGFFFGGPHDYTSYGTYIQNGSSIEFTYTSKLMEATWDSEINDHIPITTDNKYTVVDTGSLYPSHKLIGESGAEWYLSNFLSDEHKGKKRHLGGITVYVHRSTGKIIENARVRNGPSIQADYHSFYLAPGQQVTSLPQGTEIEILGRSEHKTIIDNIDMHWYFCQYTKINNAEPEWPILAYGWIWGGLIDFI